MEDVDNSLELGDTENFKGAGDIGFNHSTLIMRSFQAVLTAGCTELRPGWFNNKTDKNGNIVRTYIPDTRKTFIESIRTAEMMLSCDFDKEAEDKIKAIKNNLLKEEEELIKQNDLAWSSLSDSDKNSYISAGQGHNKGTISMPLLKQRYIESEMEAQRQIFSELNKLAKRLDFFASEQVEG